MSRNLPIRAVFCDLDGTLLNTTYRISEYTASVLKQLRQKDIRFIVCTGRPYPDVFATVRKCGLHPDYIITSNGARVHDGNFNLIVSHDMDPAIVEQLVQMRPTNRTTLSKDCGAPLFANMYQDDRWVVNRSAPEIISAYDEDFTCVDLGDAFHDLKAEQLRGVHHFWFQIALDGSPEDLAETEELLQAQLEATKQISLTSSHPSVLEMLPYGITKGGAVRDVAERLGLTLEEVACFGDGMNDVSMLEIAGTPYIMGNAPAMVRAAVPHGETIGTNAEDGVARKLAQLFL